MMTPAVARSVQGVAEHESERTQTCVSERAQATTPEWPATDGAPER